ncbi:MAG: HIT family protein [Fimbriimonadaceae bacterium]|nr:HIT family protein [Chthonomonadaceae bacterium]MCO5296529.1 HIT family protein [Fimbriimonadaceae bacterium]
MPQSPWWPSERWDELVEGRNCPLCQVLAYPEKDEEAVVVADLEASRLRLARNQFVRGYCVLVSHVHAKEPYELAPEVQAAFFRDLMRAAKALDRVFQPVKMNYQILGNQVPHLHAHLLPRYADDGAPGAPLAPGSGHHVLNAEELERRVQTIRIALEEG